MEWRQACRGHAEPGLFVRTGPQSAGLFGIDPANIYIRSPFLGGDFRLEGAIWAPQVLGIMAARLVGRPVKLVTRREQMFGPVGHRAQTRQTLRLAALADGTLTALDHHTLTASSTFDDFFEPSSGASHTIYATSALSTSHEAVRLDTGTPFFMRAPGEASGNVALESAIDEMADACGMDPLAFRLRTTLSSSRSQASHSHRKRCANAMSAGLNGSAGPAARAHRVRCATVPAC